MWFVGSLFLVWINVRQLVWIVACLFAISSISMYLLDNVSEQKIERESKIEQIKAGWQTLFKIPVLRKIALMEILETIADTVWIAAILYRSEEHTSELQSRGHIVCRLLLEKKKKP